MAGTVKLLHLLLCICYQAMVSLGMGNINSTNELALLSFKNMLSSGSSSLLASWNTSSHFCKWTGVVCGRRHQDRVVALRMGSFNLSGHISPFLGNLSFLKELDLHDNQLVGRVPMELGHLSRLQVLNLSTNYLGGSIPVSLGGCTKLKKLELSNNQLQGEIPYEIGALKSLILLSLEKNGLSGEIPRSLTDLQSIQYLSLYSNTLSGEIPPSWGNLTNLQHLDLCTNLLSGTIPSSLGMLSGLYWLDLGHNNLSGLIPTSLWNISSLALFSVRQNMLNGTIPSYIFNNVPRLLKLYMDSNQFYGPIPASISNASDVTELQLNTNFFGGILPREVGNLRALTVLQLNWNFFQAKEPKDWEFLTALTNCSQLQILALAGNKLGGVLPDSFSNLSTSLTIITLNVNRITGGIPKNIGNLVNLQILALNNNSFTGSIPSSLFRLNSLVMFYAYSNNLSGSIPQTIGNLTGLTYLHLDVNDFSGTIPSTFGNLTQLAELGLSGNYLTGLIPSELFNIPTLSTVLDLSENNLEGSLPRNIGNLNNLIRFYAQSNNLSGEIPMSISKCQLLQYIFLQNNSLNGSIPLPLSQIRSLEIVDLSSNNLSGQIPKSLGELTMLQYINLSFNYFDGEVPDSGVFTNVSAISIQGNGKLCGGIPELQFPTCSLLLRKGKHRNLKVPVITSLVTTLIILPLLCMLLIWHKKIKSKIRSTDCMPGHQLISYSELVRATNGFSTANLLGSGSFGSVYKGENGQSERTTIVAVKVLKLQTPNALKSFVAECETLRNLRHRNLVKIITICSSIDNRGNDFKAIVYDFMLNGSLEGWLHPDTNDHHAEERYLNLTERVTILLDVAYALDYLHCQGPEPVVHCDLKSSNVLLDADMVAHIGDFGLAKILVQGSQLLQQSTSSMGFRGTIGYAAPEYGVGNMVSTHGDIYSYGILVLETITGNRPTDSRLRQGLNLREHVDQALHNRTMDAVDSRLSVDLENVLHNMGDSSYKRKMDCVLSLLRLGMSCTLDSPSSRTPTGCIIKELLSIKESLLREDRTIDPKQWTHQSRSYTFF